MLLALKYRALYRMPGAVLNMFFLIKIYLMKSLSILWLQFPKFCTETVDVEQWT
jgi:hypothetical protein